MRSNIYLDEIIPGKLKVDIIFETDNVMAFHHTKPYWEHHVIPDPRKHSGTTFNIRKSNTKEQ